MRRWIAHSFFYSFSTSLSTVFYQAYAIRALNYNIEELGTLTFINISALSLGGFVGLLLVYRFREQRLILWKLFTSLNLIAWATSGFTDLTGIKLLFPLLVFIAQFSGSIGGLAYSDTIADVVPREDSIRVFSYVGVYTSAATLIGLVTGTVLFSLMHYTVAYRIIYTVALCTALVSAWFLLTLWKLASRPSIKITLKDLAARFQRVVRSEGVKHYMVFITTYTFSVNLPAALWNYYIIRVFKGSEVWISVNSIASTLATVVGNYIVSKLHRLIKPRTVLITAAILIIPIPVLFLLASTITLQALLHLYSGFVWSFLNNMANIYNLYIAGGEDRVYFLSILSVFNNLSAATASRVGASIATLGLLHLQAVFILSALGRTASVIYAQRRLRSI